MTPKLSRAIIDGAYWLREPGPNPEIIVVYPGRRRARGDRSDRADGRGSARCRLLAVTSADRLYAGWSAAQIARENRQEPRVESCRAPARRRAAAMRAGDGDRRPSGDAGLARFGRRPQGALAWGSIPSGRPARSPSSIAPMHRSERHPHRRPGHRARPVPSATRAAADAGRPSRVAPAGGTPLAALRCLVPATVRNAIAPNSTGLGDFGRPVPDSGLRSPKLLVRHMSYDRLRRAGDSRIGASWRAAGR